MATDTLSGSSAFPVEFRWNLSSLARSLLKPLSSLRLTVVLFALSIFIIFVGTLAQVDKDMWEVIDLYFRSSVAWIDLQLFFPATWFPSLAGKIPGRFPMPGGFSIGVLMALNLLAAHLVRFKIQSKGPELLVGLAIVAVGSLVTYWVIAAGHSQHGLQGQPPFGWATLWMGMRASLFLLAVVSAIGVAITPDSASPKRMLLLGLAIVSGGLGAWSMTTLPSPSSLRILWQLIQGGASGIILLVGCLLAFKKRAGIVLLHTGIGLMMFSEFFVSQYAVEGRMTIREGETMNYLRDIREIELAIVDSSKDKTDDVIVVPESRLITREHPWLSSSAKPTDLISDDKLPFDIHVERFIANADLVDAKPGDDNYANKGSGVSLLAKEVRASSGTDGGEIDMAAAYVEFRNKNSGESLGRYLLSQIVAANDQAEQVSADGQTYKVTLRFKRMYKPYQISLKDVRKDDYLGTNTPMNYSSEVVLTEERNRVGEFKIWMNNPLRYSGETFYQSGYNVVGGQEITDLQVVSNTGWMMPYVGCMLVVVGMSVHFSMGLWRFLMRLTRDAASTSEIDPAAKPKWRGYVIPGLIVLLFAGYVGSKLRAPTDRRANMRIHEFGKLPVVYQGRVKPLDTLARNTLRIVSNKEAIEDTNQENHSSRRKPKLPAIRWMLDVISGAPEAKSHRVFRIDNLDVLATLGLPRRKGFRYAEQEFEDKIPELEKQLAEARALEAEDRSFYQRKLFEVERRIRAVRLLEAAFARIFPPLPTQEEFEQNSEEAIERIQRIRMLMDNADRIQAMLDQMEPPLAVPVGGDQEWLAFSTAWNTAYAAQYRPEEIEVPQTTLLWDDMMRSYAAGETKVFNQAVEEYHELLRETPPEKLDRAKVDYEHFFNYFQPFKYSLILYVVSFVLVAVGWLSASFGYFKTINRTATWLLIFTFALHTFALASRIYISGRPPVTNLYSSAVFIGWGAVALGLVLEFIFKLGIGNAVASISGLATLQIAYALAADGDTFTVLQAVLDTQFWLATHVVCISMGYLGTFVAGLLGAIYLLSMAWRHPKRGKVLTSMTYGTLCFAIFFSFWGTVLGGLWADDSWGRFWGWDPKENGALIIVLWNALILHARWGGMVGQRGLAMLAVGGNITTSWSWFGVNELGVGLHSYGFTEGVLRNLGLFVISQLAIILFGYVAMRWSAPTNRSAAQSA